MAGEVGMWDPGWTGRKAKAGRGLWVLAKGVARCWGSGVSGRSGHAAMGSTRAAAETFGPADREADVCDTPGKRVRFAVLREEEKRGPATTSGSPGPREASLGGAGEESASHQLLGLCSPVGTAGVHAPPARAADLRCQAAPPALSGPSPLGTVCVYTAFSSPGGPPSNATTHVFLPGHWLRGLKATSVSGCSDLPGLSPPAVLTCEWGGPRQRWHDPRSHKHHVTSSTHHCPWIQRKGLRRGRGGAPSLNPLPGPFPHAGHRLRTHHRGPRSVRSSEPTSLSFYRWPPVSVTDRVFPGLWTWGAR